MGSGVGSCFSGSNLPGTSTVLAPFISSVAVAVSSSESGSLSVVDLVIASLIPFNVGQETLSVKSSSRDSRASLCYANVDLLLRFHAEGDESRCYCRKEPRNSSSTESSGDWRLAPPYEGGRSKSSES